jgi:hypothetical protein
MGKELPFSNARARDGRAAIFVTALVIGPNQRRHRYPLSDRCDLQGNRVTSKRGEQADDLNLLIPFSLSSQIAYARPWAAPARSRSGRYLSRAQARILFHAPRVTSYLNI